MLEISDQYLKLQLLFEDAKLVSSSSEYDQIEIQFIQPEVFVNLQGVPVRSDTSLVYEIPPQI